MDSKQIIKKQEKELNKLRLQVESLTNERNYVVTNLKALKNKIYDIENSKGYRLIIVIRKILRGGKI